MKRKVKLNKYEWNTVIIALFRAEKESASEPYKAMYRKAKEKIETQLYGEVSIDDLEEVQERCDVCGGCEPEYRCVSCNAMLCEDCAEWTEDGQCMCPDCYGEEGESEK